MSMPRVLPSKTVLKAFIEKDPVLLPLADLVFIDVPAFGYCQPFWVKKMKTSMFLSVPWNSYFHTAVLILIGLCTPGRIRQIKRFLEMEGKLTGSFQDPE